MTPRKGKLDHRKNEQSPSHKLRARLRHEKRVQRHGQKIEVNIIAAIDCNLTNIFGLFHIHCMS